MRTPGRAAVALVPVAPGGGAHGLPRKFLPGNWVPQIPRGLGKGEGQAPPPPRPSPWGQPWCCQSRDLTEGCPVPPFQLGWGQVSRGTRRWGRGSEEGQEGTIEARPTLARVEVMCPCVLRKLLMPCRQSWAEGGSMSPTLPALPCPGLDLQCPLRPNARVVGSRGAAYPRTTTQSSGKGMANQQDGASSCGTKETLTQGRAGTFLWASLSCLGWVMCVAPQQPSTARHSSWLTGRADQQSVEGRGGPLAPHVSGQETDLTAEGIRRWRDARGSDEGSRLPSPEGGWPSGTADWPSWAWFRTTARGHAVRPQGRPAGYSASGWCMGPLPPHQNAWG